MVHIFAEIRPRTPVNPNKAIPEAAMPHPTQKKRRAGKTQTNTHTPPTPARTGGARPKPVTRHTRPRPQPGLAGLPPNPNKSVRTTNLSQKWRGKAETRSQAHTP